MTKKELIWALTGILLFAALAEAIWLYEIAVKVGWVSLAWLKTGLVSPYFICFCAATAYIMPFVVKYKQLDSRVILTWLSFICLNIAVFSFGDAVLKNLFSRFIIFLSFNANIKMRLFGLIGVGIFAFGYHLITHHLIFNVRKQQAALFLLSVFLMFFLGIVTAFFIPGLGNSSGIADAVKMGYPQFWICILLGVSGIFTITHFSDKKEGIGTPTVQ